MATKSILLAIADPQALTDISQALGTEWMPTSVRNEPEALAQMRKYAFDALLIDFNLGSPDASEFLSRALEERPETVRFLLAYEADLALVAAKVTGPHQLLPKPLELASLKSRIEEGVAAEDPTAHKANDPAAGAMAAPKVPAIYAEVLKAFEEPGVTGEQVGEIIARDEALTAEVIRLAASGYLGLPRNLTRPAEAVESLGLEAVKVLVQALRFLAEHSHLRPGYLSFDEIWQHSRQVAQIARDLVLFETKDRALATEAFAAGLVHDLGKVVLVTNFDDLYGRVHSLARKQPVALWEVEKEMFGASHGEIGGCLIGMWNLPLPIVDAAALHHEPPTGEQQLTPLAAVHIANVLEHQLHPSDDYRVAPVMDTRFLNELGLLERLPIWRAAFANRSQAGAAPEPELAETETIEAPAPAPAELLSAPEYQEAEPAGETWTATSGQARSDGGQAAVATTWVRRGGWIYACAAGALLLLLTLWFGKRHGLNEPLVVNARTTAAAPRVISQAPTTEAAPAPAPAAAQPNSPSEATAAVKTSTIEKPAAPQAPSAQESAPTTPQPKAATAAPITTVPSAVAANATPSAAAAPAGASQAPPTAAIAPKKAPEFRLNGIIYTVDAPSAIVNGKMVFVGEKINGATVVAIGPKQVALRINGQLKTYDLK